MNEWSGITWDKMKGGIKVTLVTRYKSKGDVSDNEWSEI